MFNLTTLEENNCIPKRGSKKPKSFVSDLIDMQKGLRDEVAVLIATVDQKDAEIVTLRTRSYTQGEKRANFSGELKVKNTTLHERVKKLEAQVKSLTTKNNNFN